MQVTGNFPDFYNETMLPALHALTDAGQNQRPAQFPRIFKIEGSTRGVEQFSQVSGVGRAQQLAVGQAVRKDQPVQGYNKTFKHIRYGLGVATTREVVDDDKNGLIAQMHKDLGWSITETREIDAAGTFNNAFTNSAAYLGPDGVPLCSASHPLWKVGGLQSNAMSAADLDMYPLQLMLTAYRRMRRPSGELIRLGKPKLVVSPVNSFLAYQLTSSKDDPSTTDRGINPLGAAENGIPEVMVWDYLTGDEPWFLVAPAPETGLRWFDRNTPYNDSWTDKETEIGVTAIRYRKSHGWFNYLGVVGNPGV